MSPHDDARGIGVTMAFPPGHIPLVQILAATPTVVAVVNAVIVGTLVGLVAGQVGFGGVAVVGAVVSAGLTFLVHAAWGRAAIARAQTRLVPLFPSPPDG
jgi:hypothetical protein